MPKLLHTAALIAPMPIWSLWSPYLLGITTTLRRALCFFFSTCYCVEIFIYLYAAIGSYLEYLRDLETKIDQDWDSISSSLEEMRKSLFSKKGCLINLTSDWKNLEKSSQHIAKFLDSLPSNPSLGSDPWLSRLPSVNEAIVVPTQVRAISLNGLQQ